MTVAELIERLRALPQDAPVIVCEEGYPDYLADPIEATWTVVRERGLSIHATSYPEPHSFADETTPDAFLAVWL